VKAVLEGLVPLQVQNNQENNTRGSTRGRRNELVRYAEDLGAQVVNGGGLAGVTHCIASNEAARDGTDKVNRCSLINNCAVVGRGWLLESYWRLERAAMLPHLLRPMKFGAAVGVGEAGTAAVALAGEAGTTMTTTTTTTTTTAAAENEDQNTNNGGGGGLEEVHSGHKRKRGGDNEPGPGSRVDSSGASPSTSSGSEDDEDFARSLLAGFG